MFEDIFWTTSDGSEDSRPTDPLGLDAMREELADRLVRYLTGRTRSVEDFFWTMVFIRWVKECSTETERIRRFLQWERCWKLCRAKQGETGFAGINRAQSQAKEDGAPSTEYRPLLKNQRSQGLLGAHLVPLRKLGFVRPDRLELTEVADTRVAGAGNLRRLKDGDWNSWRAAFGEARKGYSRVFREAFREALRSRMPKLHKALCRLGWPKRQTWGRAARWIGDDLRPYALLAHEFCDWAEEVREAFNRLVFEKPGTRIDLPPALKGWIPPDLERWKPLRKALESWSPREPERVLAQWHGELFSERGYGRDLWVYLDGGRAVTFPGRASGGSSWERDCRWSNAVQVMGPRRV
jgi:hypothetical protein